MPSSRSAAPETPSWGEFWPETPIRIAIDPNGNLTEKTENGEVWTYEWNARNELTRVTKDTVEVATFKYDPLGRRIEKVAGGVTTSWVYDGIDIFRETIGAATSSYVRGPGIDEPLRKETATGNLYYHADGLGSIVATTDASGVLTFSRRYDAWGRMETGAGQAGYAFTGREWDAETGLYYYRARYYEPTAGRFISEDPIDFRGGDNFYSYVRNRPPSMRDPSGLIDVNTVVDTIVDVVGKVWNSPNTVVGLAFAAPAQWTGGSMSFGNNAIQFTDHPLMPRYSAVTLGNVVCYGRGAGPNSPSRAGPPLKDHERQHTYQGEVLGPLYLPLHINAWAVSEVISGNQYDANPLETGPSSPTVPQPWPWP